MAKLTENPTVGITVTFVCDEEELRALDALAGYGDDAFIKAFYERLGKAYMERHEQGLRRFLSTIREFSPSILSRTNNARAVFVGEKIAAHHSERPAR